jgi:hypothetical protein
MGKVLRSEIPVRFRSLKRLAGAFTVALALLGLSAGTASGQATAGKGVTPLTS